MSFDWTRVKKDSAVEVLGTEIQDRMFGLDTALVTEICSSSTLRAAKCIYLEYAQFSRILPPDGIYLIPVRDCVNRWDGCYFVSAGPFEGSIIRFLIKISDNYPFEKPEIVCTQSVPFHPLFDQRTGKLDTEAAFPHWSSNGWINDLLFYLEQVLVMNDCTVTWISDYIQSDCHEMNEAGRVLLENKDLFNSRASSCAEESLKYLYQEPDSSIKFNIKNPPKRTES